jgi:hypothetical protein
MPTPKKKVAKKTSAKKTKTTKAGSPRLAKTKAPAGK